MGQESRGYGTAIVASFGILGAVFASLIGDFFSWKVAFLVGGGMGLGLLALRAGLLESKLYEKMSRAPNARVKIQQLLFKPQILIRYLCCIFIGVPIWFVIGTLITFAPELSQALGVKGAITGSQAILWSYLGLSCGDLMSGLLSQWLKSRKLAVLLFLGATLTLTLVYVHLPTVDAVTFYILCSALGFATGYWAVFVTIAAEQFGTNVRATVATTVPNFVRGAVVPISLSIGWLRTPLGLMNAVELVGLISLTLAFVALYFLRETYGQNLDYFEA